MSWKSYPRRWNWPRRVHLLWENPLKRKTLTQYLVEQQRQAQAVGPEVRRLIEVVARACKAISHAVSKGALGGVLGSLNSENVQGEVRRNWTYMSNEVLLEANEWGGHLAAMASEEMETIHLIPNRYPKGEYLLLFDPLDGSSNIDVNVSIGAIFLLLHAPHERHGQPVTEKDFLQCGNGRCGRLCRLQAAKHAGSDRGQRRGRLYPGPGDGILGADMNVASVLSAVIAGRP